jgi:hypothetical protein
VLTVPPGSEDVVIDNVGSTVSEKVFEAVFEAESVAVTIMLKVPDAPGVPLMAPVEALSVMPEGMDDPLAATHVQL